LERKNHVCSQQPPAVHSASRRSESGFSQSAAEQFGGPQGELAAACRYFTQAVSEDDPDRKDLLFDIATEELSHLEIIGSIVAMLNKGGKGQLAEAVNASGSFAPLLAARCHAQIAHYQGGCLAQPLS
jgi:Mn-containing catalase